MNQERKSAAGRPVLRDREQERKESLVLLLIAVLFVANVVIYLCHHYGLTSLNDWRPHLHETPQVIID